MERSEQDRRALADSLLSAWLTTSVARRLRPACIGAQEQHFRALVTAIVECQMRTYAARPPA